MKYQTYLFIYERWVKVHLEEIKIRFIFTSHLLIEPLFFINPLI